MTKKFCKKVFRKDLDSIIKNTGIVVLALFGMFLVFGVPYLFGQELINDEWCDNEWDNQGHCYEEDYFVIGGFVIFCGLFAGAVVFVVPFYLLQRYFVEERDFEDKGCE